MAGTRPAMTAEARQSTGIAISVGNLDLTRPSERARRGQTQLIGPVSTQGGGRAPVASAAGFPTSPRPRSAHALPPLNAKQGPLIRLVPTCHWSGQMSAYSADRPVSNELLNCMVREDNVMAPEFPVDLTVLDMRFENGELVGSVHFVERRDDRKSLYVTWNAISAPKGFLPVAGGVVYVKDTPEPVLPPSYDVRLDAFGNDRYGWSFKKGTDLMMVLVFPKGYVPRDCQPHLEMAAAFDGRITAYWKSQRVRWTMKRLESDLAEEVAQLNRDALPTPRQRIGGVDIINAATAEKAGGVFICYRREDSSYPARIIRDRLAERLRPESIFFDIDSIDLGVDWVEVLADRVGACDALVAIIGKTWASCTDQDGHRRLDDPRDFVRIEIEAALKRKVHVIPVTVEGAPMPKADELPRGLKDLPRRNGIALSHTGFDAEVEKLVGALVAIVEKRRHSRAEA